MNLIALVVIGNPAREEKLCVVSILIRDDGLMTGTPFGAETAAATVSHE